MTHDELKAGYRKIIDDQIQYSDRLNRASALWLFIGTISLHESRDGWFKLTGTTLLFAIFLYEVFGGLGFKYKLKNAREALKNLDSKLQKIPQKDIQLINISKEANTELGKLFP